MVEPVHSQRGIDVAVDCLRRGAGAAEDFELEVVLVWRHDWELCPALLTLHAIALQKAIQHMDDVVGNIAAARDPLDAVLAAVSDDSPGAKMCSTSLCDASY